MIASAAIASLGIRRSETRGNSCTGKKIRHLRRVVQTHSSLANWHPHIHLIATDGGFRSDDTFVPWSAHDTAALTEAFRRAVPTAVADGGC